LRVISIGLHMILSGPYPVLNYLVDNDKLNMTQLKSIHTCR
jgi:hypothetical protein